MKDLDQRNRVERCEGQARNSRSPVERLVSAHVIHKKENKQHSNRMQ